MKQVLLISFLFMKCFVFSQNTLVQAEQDLCKSYKKIISYRFNADSIPWDLLEKENHIFKMKLKQLCTQNPQSLSYEFDSLKADILIVTSEDKLFRIYSWDTWLGGSMLDFENVFQFQSNAKVYSKMYYDTVTTYEGGFSPFYSEIHTLKANNKTYYLAIGNNVFSGKDSQQSINIYTIENDTLNNTSQLIKTRSGFTNSIEVNFDFFSVVDRPERPVRLIKYDNEKKIIYIPVVYENAKVTNRFILYTFNGNYFEYTKTEK